MSFSGNQYPNNAEKVITTQGDLVRGNSSGERERLGIGSANQVLQSNGTTESWQTLSTADSVLTTQGDILYQNASGLARLGQSTDGHVLTTKGAAANPVWAAVSSSGWSQLASVNLSGGAASTLTATLSSATKSFLDINIWGGFASADILGCRMGNGSVSTASVYADNISQIGGTNTATTGNYSDFNNSITGSNFYVKIFYNNNSVDLNSWVGTMTSNNLQWRFSGYFNSSVQIDKFEIFGSDGSNDLGTATNMVVYGI